MLAMPNAEEKLMINRSIEVNSAVGSRICAVRQAGFGDDLDKVSRLFETTIERWRQIEAGEAVMDQNALIAFSLRLGVSPEFILLGNAAALRHGLSERITADPGRSDSPNPVFWHFRFVVEARPATTH